MQCALRIVPGTADCCGREEAFEIFFGCKVCYSVESPFSLFSLFILGVYSSPSSC